MSKYATWVTNIETAIDAAFAAIADGEDTVEYEIRGRRHKRVPSTDLIKELFKLYDIAKARADRQSNGWLRVARLQRPSRIGSD